MNQAKLAADRIEGSLWTVQNVVKSDNSVALTTATRSVRHDFGFDFSNPEHFMLGVCAVDGIEVISKGGGGSA